MAGSISAQKTRGVTGMAFAGPSDMSSAEARSYRQRRPEATVLYRVVQQHLESFFQDAQDGSGQHLPKYV